MADNNLDVAIRSLGAQIGQAAINQALSEQLRADHEAAIAELESTIAGLESTIAGLRSNQTQLESSLSAAHEKIARLTDDTGEPLLGEVVPDGR